jgi:LysM repeat protein
MRHRRSPARWLAPIALVACAVAVYAIVNDSPGSGKPARTRTTAANAVGASKTRTVSERTRSARRRRSSGRKRTYVVRSGDTLSSIAQRTGVSLARLQSLNPRLDSQSLQTGQRVKLSP